MSLKSWIAFRYLKSKKSHSAVSAIAIVSIAGVAVATAAVVCVLSVFNGFVASLTDKFDSLAPEVVISPAKGKVMANADSISAIALDVEGVASAMPVVTDKALALFNGRELPVTIKGVDTDLLAKQTDFASTLLEGGRIPTDFYDEMPEFEYIEDYEEYIANTPLPEVALSIGAAVRIGDALDGDRLILFAPRREGRYNPANPLASFVTDSVAVSGIFETRQREYDEDMVIVPIGLARHLFQYDTQASSIELKLNRGTNQATIKDILANRLGEGYVVKDRSQLQEINFRMINIEKWVSFLLLAFILLVAGFNIISTMTMLVLEKRQQLSVLSALGMRRGLIGGVFRSESLMVSLSGGIIGIALGVFLCWLQQEFGLVKLAGDPTKLLMTVYPVKLIWSDVLLAFVPSVALGFITAIVAGAFARSRISLSSNL